MPFRTSRFPKTHRVGQASRRCRWTPTLALWAVSLLWISTAGANAGLQSDDFNVACGVLGAQWTVVDPRADANLELVGSGTSDARLLFSVPSGVSHDTWETGDFSPRVMQAATDSDFEVEIKFDSLPTEDVEGQGIIVEGAGGELLRFDIYTRKGKLRVFSGLVDNGSASTFLNATIAPASASIYLRVGRVGNGWTFLYSYDGSNWSTATSFQMPLPVVKVGFYVLNSGANPAHTAAVDYFFETSAPIVPEDGTVAGDGSPRSLDVALAGTGTGSVVRDPDQASYACGTAVTLNAVPDAGSGFTGWSGDVVATENPITVTVSQDLALTATFDALDGPPILSDVTTVATGDSVTVTWTTDYPATSALALGTTSAYELGTISDATETVSHSITWTGLQPDTLYHYRITSEGSGTGSSLSTGTFTTSSGGGGGGGNSGPDIDVWYGNLQRFGHNGLPQPWVNILGNVADPDGVASLTYSLNGGSSRALSMGPDDRRLADPGDFNADISTDDLRPGGNTVVITAVDGVGDVSSEVVTVEFDDQTVAPLPFSIDWSTLAQIQDEAQVVDGLWAIEGSTLRPSQFDYDRIVALGDVTWQDYEITVPVTIHSIDPSGFLPPSYRPAVGLISRWPGHTVRNSDQPAWGFKPLGAIGWVRYGEDGRTRAELYGNTLTTGKRVNVTFGVTYVFKLRVETMPGVGGLYRLRIWRQGDPEPSSWNVTLQESLSDPQEGSAAIVAHHVDASFGPVTVTPLP